MEEHRLLLSAIRPLIFLSKIFGMCPVNFDISEKQIFTVSKLKIIHGFSLIMFSLICIPFINFEMAFHGFWRLVFTGIQISCPIIFLAGCGSFICKSKLFAKILNKIFSYSSLMNHRLSFLIFWAIITEITISQIILNYYFIIWVVEDPSWDYKPILDKISKYFIFNSLLIVNIWLANLLLFLFKVLEKINADLKSSNYEKHVCKGKYKFVCSLRSKEWELTDENEKKNSLGDIIDLFNDVCDTCKMLNDCFGMTEMINTVFMKILFIFTFYELTAFDVDKGSSLFWALLHFMEFYLVLSSFELVRKEVKFFIYISYVTCLSTSLSLD